MNTPRLRRFSFAFGFGLAAALLCGCPAQPTCPNCRFRTATYTVNAGDVRGVVTATMHTQIEHATGECPSTGCNTTRTDDITCKVKGTTPGVKTQRLPVASGNGATHNVTIQVQTTAGPRPAISATVGTPSSTSPPPNPICPPPSG